MQLGTEWTFLGVLGGLGWLLAVWSILDQHDPEKEKKLHLVDKLLRATFVSVTMVASVGIALHVTLQLPGWLDERAERVVEALPRAPELDGALRPVREALDVLGRKLDEGREPTPDPTDELRRLREAIDGLGERLAGVQDLRGGLAEELRRLHAQGRLNEAEASRAAERYLGSIQRVDGGLYFHVSTGARGGFRAVLTNTPGQDRVRAQLP